MKKSKTITLTLIAPVALSLMSCSSDEQPPKDLRFNSVNDCLEYYTQEQCNNLLGKAQPLFEKQNDCESLAGSGKCQVVQSQGQSYWMPLSPSFPNSVWECLQVKLCLTIRQT